MLRYKGKSFLEYRRLKKIAKKVRDGIIPEGVEQDVIFEALKLTRPKNAVEMFGFLHAKVLKVDGFEKDYGLVSVKQVTSAFADQLALAMMTSGEVIDNFNQHKMGTGSTAENSNQTDLVTPYSGAQVATGNAAATAGATANIYRTIGTLTAITAGGIREHGVFNVSTGAGVMLDRSLVTNIDVNDEDVVTWTYELTINAGG